MRRRPRRREPRGRTLQGETFEVEVGPVAHGGHFVARHEGRVVFVRHALPGERVTARVTDGEADSRFLRADAVEVHVASPDRVSPPCPFSGPGACGGCDFQHVAVPAQRALKSAVVAEQLRRLAGLDLSVPVEAVPGDEQGLRWRTRVQYAVDPLGRRGFRRHRSHEVVPVDDCLITREDARAVIEGRPVAGSAEHNTVVEVVDSSAGRRELSVAADGFWQVHPGAPGTLVEVVMAMLGPQPGERCLDLYSGVGLFSVFLGGAVGSGGHVVAVEGDSLAAEHARHNLAPYDWAEVRRGSVDRDLSAHQGEPVDLVVLDPPREGAKRSVVERVAARAPRAVAYVACDPAALARDVAVFAESGYRLKMLRAFDIFPMTSHVEVVAHLVKGDSGLR